MCVSTAAGDEAVSPTKAAGEGGARRRFLGMPSRVNLPWGLESGKMRGGFPRWSVLSQRAGLAGSGPRLPPVVIRAQKSGAKGGSAQTAPRRRSDAHLSFFFLTFFLPDSAAANSSADRLPSLFCRGQQTLPWPNGRRALVHGRGVFTHVDLPSLFLSTLANAGTAAFLFSLGGKAAIGRAVTKREAMMS